MQKLIYGIGGLLAVLVVVGLLLGSKHRVEVSTEIDAAPATVFAQVNDFRRFVLWSPWASADPNARFVYSGPLRGRGTAMTFDGALVGSGMQLITDSRPFEYVEYAINPNEPGAARSWFRLEPGVGTTRVYWGFEADYGMNLVGRYFAPVLGNIVARDYTDGLEALKELSEGLPAADFSDLLVEHILVEAQDIAYLASSSQPEPRAMADALANAYFQILTYIDANDLSDAGAPLSIPRGVSGSNIAFDAAIPVRGIGDETPRPASGVKLGKTYAGPVIRVRHVGPYRNLSTTHRKITAYLAALGIRRNGAAWESYVSDPGKVAEKELVTEVFYPVEQEL